MATCHWPSRVLYRDVGPDCLFPLKTWTHDDVWDYLSFFKIEVQPDRYNQEARVEWEDKTTNPDWYEACIRCVDKRRAGTKVYCPKLKTEIPMSPRKLRSSLKNSIISVTYN